MSGKKNLYFAIYKPYKILSQFTDEGANKGLQSVFQLPKNVYPVGRLDLDSEGLLLLTNDKSVNNRLLNPEYQHKRCYWIEVEGHPDQHALDELQKGVEINLKGKKYKTLPCEAIILKSTDQLDSRNPPVNHKKYQKTCWLEIKLIEGKNRQVRRMTAAVGYPTLRLVRVGIEDLSVFPLKSGEITQIAEKTLKSKLRLN